MEQLIVLGNGSDLHNRLKSSYDNYVTYMDSKYKIFSKLENFKKNLKKNMMMN